jgi:hypothetical protein
LDLGELNAVLASISGGAMTAGDDDGDGGGGGGGGDNDDDDCSGHDSCQMMQAHYCSAHALKIWREEKMGVDPKARRCAHAGVLLMTLFSRSFCVHLKELA